MNTPWYQTGQLQDLLTPAILLSPARIRENIRRMVQIAASPERLRPHVKTYKLPQIIQLQLEAGISSFKCATLAEAKMVAEAGGKDILIAYPLVGPALDIFVELVKAFPNVRFSLTADHLDIGKVLVEKTQEVTGQIAVFVDIDNGMHRTGTPPGKDALELCRFLHLSPELHFKGLHIYDGHLHQASFQKRKEACQQAFQPVQDLMEQLDKEKIPLEEVVCGGTPTFPIHAEDPSRKLSPGTPLLWDWGYANSFPDLDFQIAAVLLTRVVSKPAPHLLCLDIGYKALAAEMPHPRIYFPGLENVQFLNHSEEHMVISVENAQEISVNQVIPGYPIHICPTMALHEEVYVMENSQVVGKWQVKARNRLYSQINKMNKQ
ncbi:D-TA family PLP-dependent enzyme [Rapidithrix thailandica]|uniref:D-TA family PLP-dependent enzyme n=1 Tax=Rapidithrix thailandica TaxID=413964 RepID=A0AAW9S3S1_9BACT